MATMVAPKLRSVGLLCVVACSSTAKGPAATSASPIQPQAVGSTGTASVTVVVERAATCELAMQNLNKHWVTASAQASAHVQAIYANAGAKLTPALLALCQTDAWSPAGRNCIAQAPSLTAIDLCTRDFSASQQSHLLATTAEIIDTVDVTIHPATSLGAPQP
jgi:hypothetical protein